MRGGLLYLFFLMSRRPPISQVTDPLVPDTSSFEFGGGWVGAGVGGQGRGGLDGGDGGEVGGGGGGDYGLVTEVVPGDRLIGRAMEVAGQIAANPGHATRLAKRLLREGQDMKLAPLLELSAAFQALAHHTQDHPEAVAAFIEKREPRLVDG